MTDDEGSVLPWAEVSRLGLLGSSLPAPGRRHAHLTRGACQEKRTRIDKLMRAGAEIAAAAPSGEDIAFLHTVMCQVGLPRSRVEGAEFVRRSGNAWVSLQAGFLDEGTGPVLQPLPYGPMPRLALQYVSTYAKRFKTREVPIGESASEFLKELGLSTSGGVRGGYATLRRQMHALAASRIQFGCGGRTFNGQLVEQFDAWLPMRPSQRALWPGRVLLSEHYFNDLLAYGVPLDARALWALKSSALALDVYMWLAHRLHRIGPVPCEVDWLPLAGQFGQEYAGRHANRDFKAAFLRALDAVLAVYPAARVERRPGGLLLRESPPPVPSSARRA